MLAALLQTFAPLPSDGGQAYLQFETGSTSFAYRPLVYVEQELTHQPRSVEERYRNWRQLKGIAGEDVELWVRSQMEYTRDSAEHRPRLVYRYHPIPVKHRRGAWFRWLLKLPEGYTPEKKWPLLIHLHGIGERGADLNALRLRGPFSIPRLSLPYVIVAPQLPLGGRWSVEELRALVRHLTTMFHIDASNLTVSGLGIGADAAWRFAASDPRAIRFLIAPGSKPLPSDPKGLGRVKHYSGTEPDPWQEEELLNSLAR